MMGFFDHFVTSCSRLHHLGAINFLKSAAGTIKPNVLKCKMLFRFEGEKDQNSINQLVIIAKNTHKYIPLHVLQITVGVGVDGSSFSLFLGLPWGARIF